MSQISIIVSFDDVHSLCFKYLEPIIGGAYLQCMDYTLVLDYEVEVFLLGENNRYMVGEDVTESWLEELCPMPDIRSALKKDIRRSVQGIITRILGGDKISNHHYEYQRLGDQFEYLIVDKGDVRDAELEMLRRSNDELKQRIQNMEEGWWVQDT
ncbi:MAG: hypothetical protein CMF35_02515 [Leeuwenhoekiella sp.]|nr:hypothetical protein [Leeuwenhoekiella sp.]MBQ50370.1 hypothetical protein [Leeuwenhoekiella sp.]MBQ50567.1 hypothetical protein [Leeuwenhoekiella sp.]